MGQIGGGAGYALGHSAREIERLSAQARAFEPFTRRMLEQAGISEGMRVLDVGSGAGDVAFLCAGLTGPRGTVVGMDLSRDVVEKARERAQTAGLANVTFTAGDPTTMAFEQPFDAVVGRLVLMYQPDPAAMLTKLARVLRPRGILAFQEFDFAGAHSFPPAPTFEQCLDWIEAAFAATGADTRMGAKLYGTFIRAGIPAPSLSLDAGIWGGPGNAAAVLARDVVQSLLPALVKYGIVTEEQAGIATLRERIDAEIGAGGGIAVSPALIGAWARIG